jgi:hypothetical protein
VGPFEDWGYDVEELIDGGDALQFGFISGAAGRAVVPPLRTASGRCGPCATERLFE